MTLVGTSQINSLASSGFTKQHAPSSEPQWRATFPAVFQAATPSADLNYNRPAISINRRPVTSRAPLQAPHNASCVFTERVNKSAYHLQPSINCEGIPPTKSYLWCENERKALTKYTAFAGINYSTAQLPRDHFSRQVMKCAHGEQVWRFPFHLFNYLENRKTCEKSVLRTKRNFDFCLQSFPAFKYSNRYVQDSGRSAKWHL
jgi:hypothetical protein